MFTGYAAITRHEPPTKANLYLTDLVVMESLEEIGQHYARTLRDWRERFTQNLDKVLAIGFDHSFQRKWLYYLATCEAGFAKRALGDVQIVFRKPG